uniref:Uncharacterized protein n=1 Tax=Oryza glumipatula TaxID=40148 RepID=A0A0D9ZI42_9ORYZ
MVVIYFGRGKEGEVRKWIRLVEAKPMARGLCRQCSGNDRRLRKVGSEEKDDEDTAAVAWGGG